MYLLEERGIVVIVYLYSHSGVTFVSRRYGRVNMHYKDLHGVGRLRCQVSLSERYVGRESGKPTETRILNLWAKFWWQVDDSEPSAGCLWHDIILRCTEAILVVRGRSFQRTICYDLLPCLGAVGTYVDYRYTLQRKERYVAEVQWYIFSHTCNWPLTGLSSL